jgi:hypothetical protein
VLDSVNPLASSYLFLNSFQASMATMEREETPQGAPAPSPCRRSVGGRWWWWCTAVPVVVVCQQPSLYLDLVGSFSIKWDTSSCLVWSFAQPSSPVHLPFLSHGCRFLTACIALDPSLSLHCQLLNSCCSALYLYCYRERKWSEKEDVVAGRKGARRESEFAFQSLTNPSFPLVRPVPPLTCVIP